MGQNERRILRGPPLDLSGIYLSNIIFQSIKNAGNKIFAFQVDNESRRLSYAELLDQSTRLAVALRSRGIGPGDVVSVCSENSIEYALPVLASFFVGAACSPLNYNYTSRELQHLLNITSPRVIFCTVSTKNSVLEALRPLQQQTSYKPPLLVLMPDTDGSLRRIKGFETLTDILESTPAPTQFEPFVASLNHVALILCSSGTTGLPKGVELTFGNLTAPFMIRLQYEEYAFNETSDYISCHLPMFHAIGMLIMIGAIARGGILIIFPTFSFEHLLRAIQDYKLTLLGAVPPIVQALVNSDLVSKYDLSSLKFISCGAAPLSAELQKAVSKRLNLQEIRQAYGLTEGTIGTTYVRKGLNKIGSSGSIVPGMEAKVIDEKGKLLGPYERGELCFRGLQVMKGYLKDPKATAQAIDIDGWLHTGDVGYYDDDGCFFIVDRIKELIKYNAFQVAPAELEGILLTHPGVSDAAVVGLPNTEAGELPLAFVVRKDPALTEKEVIDFVAKNVSPQKRLRGGVRFINAIPKNPSGKILRRELRQLLQNKL